MKIEKSNLIKYWQPYCKKDELIGKQIKGSKFYALDGFYIMDLKPGNFGYDLYVNDELIYHYFNNNESECQDYAIDYLLNRLNLLIKI